jgi:anti-anti-sigma regulatory factor
MSLAEESRSHSTPYLWNLECIFQVPMTLRITTGSADQRITLRLSGRIRSADVEVIREEMMNKAKGVVLDLEEVTLVDLDVVRFLGALQAAGVELVNCSPYIHDWIFRERNPNEGTSGGT